MLYSCTHMAAVGVNELDYCNTINWRTVWEIGGSHLCGVERRRDVDDVQIEEKWLLDIVVDSDEIQHVQQLVDW